MSFSKDAAVRPLERTGLNNRTAAHNTVATMMSVIFVIAIASPLSVTASSFDIIVTDTSLITTYTSRVNSGGVIGAGTQAQIAAQESTAARSSTRQDIVQQRLIAGDGEEV